MSRVGERAEMRAKGGKKEMIGYRRCEWFSSGGLCEEKFAADRVSRLTVDVHAVHLVLVPAQKVAEDEAAVLVPVSLLVHDVMLPVTVSLNVFEEHFLRNNWIGSKTRLQTHFNRLAGHVFYSQDARFHVLLFLLCHDTRFWANAPAACQTLLQTWL